MKVMATMDSIISPLSTATGKIVTGKIYTVIGEQSGYSEFGKREVDAYQLEGVDGLFEKGIFIPLSDLDEKIMVCLRTKPLRETKKIFHKFNSDEGEE